MHLKEKKDTKSLSQSAIDASNVTPAKPIVLIVDDDEENRLNVQQVLNSQFITRMASDGKSALKDIDEVVPNMIISDVRMPGMDGITFLKELQKNPRTRVIPVILLSAEGEEVKKEALQNGAVDFLAKPFQAKELLASIELNLEKKLNASRVRRKEINLVKDLPIAIFTADENGYLDFYNAEAEKLWGSAPGIGQELWRSSFTMYDMSGITIEPENYPLWRCLKERRPIDGETYIMERPDGTKRFVQPYLRPIFDDDGNLVGAIGMVIDKTEARTREEKEGKLASIVKYSDDAIISKTLDGIVTSWNAGAEKIFGYTAEEMIGQYITVLIPKERLYEEDKILSSLRKGISIDHFETKRLTKDGRLLDISLTTSPVKDSTGTVIGASKIARDITKQKKAEQTIRESEERFRRIANTAPVMIWISGKDKGCNFFNKGWLDFTGRTFEQEEGFGWTNGIHPDDKDFTTAIYNDKFDQRVEFQMESRILRHDGQYRWVNVYAAPYYDYDNSFLGYIGACVDIHEQKESKQELEKKVSERTFELLGKNRELESQKNFVETILESSVDIITVVNRDMEFVSMNRKGRDTLVNGENVAGKKIFDMFPGMKDGSLHKGVLKALRGEIVHDNNYKSYLVDRTFENFYVPLMDNDGSVNEVLIISHDVSDLLEAAHQLHYSNEMLESKNRELEQSNSELASFSYVASHDLQEPLRKIKVFGKMILEHEMAALSTSGKDYLNRMIRASSRMQDLIDALLEFSRTNTSERTFEHADINVLLTEVLRELKDNIEEKKAEIKVEGKLPALYIIPFQFKQLLLNIIGNSLKYSKENEKPQITISGKQIQASEIDDPNAVKGMDYCLLTIKDNGIGFEQQYAERIFELFQRLHGRNEYSGSGIGLAICKKIVKNHNGFIRAEGVPGVGTTMHVYIPC